MKFICTECGHRDDPCQHYQETHQDQDSKFIRSQLLDIVNLLNEIRDKLVSNHAVGGSSGETGAKPEAS